MIKRARVNYLDVHAVRGVYEALYDFSIQSDEPLASFDRALVQPELLEGILGGVQQAVFDKELYPTIPDKASFLFYSLAKNHVFINGNKRMASLCVEVFLLINDYTFEVTAEEFTEKVLEIVLSDARQHETVKRLLSAWILDYSRILNDGEILR